MKGVVPHRVLHCLSGGQLLPKMLLEDPLRLHVKQSWAGTGPNEGSAGPEGDEIGPKKLVRPRERQTSERVECQQGPRCGNADHDEPYGSPGSGDWRVSQLAQFLDHESP